MKFVADFSDRHDNQMVLVPFDAAAERFLREQRDGEPIDVEVLYPRDMVRHRAIFSQIGELAKALHRTPESVRAELLFATGNFSRFDDQHGVEIVAVNSMSRHAMRDHELEQFWNEAVGIIVQKLLPEIDNAAERERLLSKFVPEPA